MIIVNVNDNTANHYNEKRKIRLHWAEKLQKAGV